MEQKIVEIFNLCSETHHMVYKKISGNDPEWALWYAHWLLTLSDLPQLLPKLETESELVYALLRLDKEYTEKSISDTWQSYYAKYLIENYSK